MGKNARDRRKGLAQSRILNSMTEERYFSDLIRIASNRFRWVGLPDSVNVKYLEMCLLRYGMATIAEPRGAEGLWYGLQVGGISSELNAYGEPMEWTAQGVDAKTMFEVSGDNGVLIYNSNQIYSGVGSNDSTWLALSLFARKLAHYDRTEDVNLQMQQTAWFITCEQQKKAEALNMYKQIAGFEPAIITSPNVQNEVGVDVFKTDVPFIGEELNTAKRNVWNAAYEYLGIPHLSFQKGERMIEEEAEGNNAPTNIRLLDGLQPRRRAAQQLSKLMGKTIEVVYNTDFESRNYIFTHEIETGMQESHSGGGLTFGGGELNQVLRRYQSGSKDNDNREQGVDNDLV